jgi:acetylornithine deacetylase
MADLDHRQQRIIEATEKLEADIVDFACRLVAEPSTLGDEASALEVMETGLEQLGFESKKVAIDPQTLANHPGFAPVPWGYENRYNVVGYRPADRKDGRSLLLNGHLDVVDPGCLDFWRNDPFSPVVKDGWLYGRGAGDMKSNFTDSVQTAMRMNETYEGHRKVYNPLAAQDATIQIKSFLANHLK